MAPIHSLICFLSLTINLAYAAPWIVTAAYEKEVYTQRYLSEVVTNINLISPTATLPAEALSTIVSTDAIESYTIIEKLYPTGYGVERHNYYGYNDYSVDREGNYHATVYKANVTYSAPTGCSTQWTATSAVAVTPPAEIRNLLPKETVTNSTSIDNSQPFQPTTYFYEVVFVDPTQVPSLELSSASRYNRPTASYEGAGCRYTSSGGSSSYYGGYYGDYYDDDDWFTSKWGMGIGISGLALVLICILGWAGLFFFLGMIEAWVRFRRLMTGWQTRRGFPLFWAFSCFPISLFFLFCFRKGFRARSREDAEVLKKRWNEMSFGTKLRLYFAWGFRFKYPTVLGPPPPRVSGSKKPTEPGPQLLETPPSTNVPLSDGSQRAVPEMVQPAAQPSGGLSESRDADIGQAR